MTPLSRRGVVGGLGALTAATAMKPRRAKAADPVTVWWTQGFYQQEDQALKDSVANYEKQSGVKIDLQIMNGPDLITKLIAALHVNDVPDVVQAVTAGTFLLPQAVWNDQILEISDVVSTRESEFLPAALDGGNLAPVGRAGGLFRHRYSQDPGCVLRILPDSAGPVAVQGQADLWTGFLHGDQGSRQR